MDEAAPAAAGAASDDAAAADATAAKKPSFIGRVPTSLIVTLVGIALTA
jgi:hypothetical protein